MTRMAFQLLFSITGFSLSSATINLGLIKAIKAAISSSQGKAFSRLFCICPFFTDPSGPS